ncbi:MAG: Na+/H+ antiporter subunit E [Defluviitaleaceae bacterium]|nr:Na+/H+ antiporter subunit E [Defluviitaleaceae bacterium]
MTKMYIYIATLLILAWIVVAENTHWMIITSGILVSLICIFMMRKLLPLDPIKNISLLRLTLYPLFILGPIFRDSIYVLKIIFTDGIVEEVKVKTEIKNPFLRVLLTNSIAITPGSLPIALEDNIIHCVWLRPKNSQVKTLEDPGETLKGTLERYIKKMEK